MQRKIAITGGIGSGKSLVAKYIAEMGYPVFSCDEINRDLLTDDEYIRKIADLFPDCVRDNKIDKNALKTTVFSNPAALEILNKTAHPIIMQRLFFAMESSESVLVFAEVPLLFESNAEKAFNEIIIITRDLEKRIQAIQQRDGLTIGEIEKRIAVQFDYNTLPTRIQNLRAHIVKNNGDKTALKIQIQQLIEHL